MNTDHAIKALTGSGTTVIILTIGCLCTSMLFFVVSAILWVVLRYRVVRLASQIASKQADLSRLAAEQEAQALLSRQMSADLEELRKRLLSQDETRPATANSWTGPLNLNRRGQILRLSRKGKSVAEIASDLNVAQGEVELLLKVSDLSLTPSGTEK